MVPDALSRAEESSFNVAAVGPVAVEDAWYARKLAAVERTPRKYPDLRIKDGLLYAHRPNKWIDPLMEDLDAWKLLLPLANRENTLRESHYSPQAGHLGIEKSYARLATHYYWPGCYYDTCCFVRACQECQRHKNSQALPAGLMSDRNIEGPWVCVSGDIMGPKPPSKKGFRYIIVFQDLFTKYVELRALRRADAKSVTEAFDELVVNRWGCPRYFITDNGTEFANKVVTARLEEYGVIQSTIPPYHAQSNPTERVNKTLKTMINCFLAEDHREWDGHLAEFGFALNTMAQSSTKLSPVFLNLGRNPVPSQLLSRHLENPLPLAPGDTETWCDRVKRLPALHDLVKRHLEKANARQASYYNRNRRDIEFHVGDRVLRRNHVLSSAEDRFAAKHAPLFVGPVTIVEALSPTVYIIEDDSSGKKIKVHVQDLKKFIAPRVTTKEPSPDFSEKTSDGDDGPDPRLEPLPAKRGRGRPRRDPREEPQLRVPPNNEPPGRDPKTCPEPGGSRAPRRDRKNQSYAGGTHRAATAGPAGGAEPRARRVCRGPTLLSSRRDQSELGGRRYDELRRVERRVVDRQLVRARDDGRAPPPAHHAGPEAMPPIRVGAQKPGPA